MNRKSPLVSVVVPTYNHAQFLREALSSVVKQRYQNWEAIIVNNYSVDNTEEVVTSYREQRIRLVNFANNGVIGASRNEGIRLSSGTYVAFLDSDDTWVDSKLERCVSELEEGCDVVGHRMLIKLEGGKTVAPPTGPSNEISYDLLLFGGNVLATSSTVVRREAMVRVGDFRTEDKFITAEDYDLWLRIAKANFQFRFLPDLLGEYRVHEGNAGRYGRVKKATLNVLDDHFASLEKDDFVNRVRKRKRRSDVIAIDAWEFQKVREYRVAIAECAESLRVWPLNGKAYVVGLVTVGDMLVRSIVGALRAR
jgi:glycosyltransferase involved in cell wall biosynthesis